MQLCVFGVMVELKIAVAAILGSIPDLGLSGSLGGATWNGVFSGNLA